MRPVVIIVVLAVVVLIRVSMRSATASAADQAAMVAGEEAESAGQATMSPASAAPVATTTSEPSSGRFEARFGDVGIVAMREITERLRGRIFRVGTIIMLLAVGAAIVIPNFNTTAAAVV